MIKVNYYLNEHILFFEEWKTIYDKPFVKNYKIRHNNRCYIITNCYYDMFEHTINVILNFAPGFQCDAFLKNWDNNIIGDLEMLGYTKSEVSGEGKNIITNAHLGLYYFTDCDYSNGGMGYVCETSRQFIAIASIQDKCDIHQWFRFFDGDIDKCGCLSRIDEWGDWEDNPGPIKLTLEEILTHKLFKEVD